MEDFDKFVKMVNMISLLSIVIGIVLLLYGMVNWAAPMLVLSVLAFVAANINL